MNDVVVAKLLPITDSIQLVVMVLSKLSDAEYVS